MCEIRTPRDKQTKRAEELSPEYAPDVFALKETFKKIVKTKADSFVVATSFKVNMFFVWVR